MCTSMLATFLILCLPTSSALQGPPATPTSISGHRTPALSSSERADVDTAIASLSGPGGQGIGHQITTELSNGTLTIRKLPANPASAPGVTGIVSQGTGLSDHDTIAVEVGKQVSMTALAAALAHEYAHVVNIRTGPGDTDPTTNTGDGCADACNHASIYIQEQWEICERCAWLPQTPCRELAALQKNTGYTGLVDACAVCMAGNPQTYSMSEPPDEHSCLCFGNW